MKTTKATIKKSKAIIITLLFAVLIAATSFALLACNGETTRSLSVITLPTRTEFVVGQALSLDGGYMNIARGNAEPERVPMTLVGVTAYPMTLSTIGRQQITVTFEGVSDSFYVDVRPNTTSIDIDTMPVAQFIYGQRLVLSGGYVTLINSGHANERVSMNDSRLVFSPEYLQTIGSTMVTIRLTVNNNVLRQFPIPVNPIMAVGINSFTGPTTSIANTGDDIATAFSGGQIYTVFNNGTSRVIHMNSDEFLNLFRVTGFARVPGEYRVRIAARGDETQYEEFDF